MSEGITDIEESQIQTNYDKVVYKFDDMELDENLLRGVFGTVILVKQILRGVFEFL